MKAVIILFISLLVYQGSSCAAEEMPPEDLFLEDEAAFQEDQQIFTATKFSISMRRAPAVATIITDDEIRNSGARDLADVLNMVPGMAVHKTRMGIKSVEIRGINSTNTEKLLVMMNGHRLNTPFFGGAIRTVFDDLPLDNIRRIEVIRGPGSALYGANAFSGVVNILTKEAMDTYGLKVTAGAGNFDTRRFNLLYGGETELFSLSASLSYLTTDGDNINVDADKTTFIGAPGSSMAPGKTDDWREKYDFTLNLKAGDFRIDLHHSEKVMGPYIGVAFALSDESTQRYEYTFGHLKYQKVITSNLTFTANAYMDRHRFSQNWEIFPEGFAGAAFPDGLLGHPEATNRTLGTEWQLDYLMEDHFFTVGAMYEDIKQYDVKHRANFDGDNGNAPLAGGFQNVTDTLNFNKNTERRIWAAYLQDSWSVRDNLDLTLGVRHDNYSDTDNTTNPRLGLVWSFNPNGELKLLYGTAFRAPNFEELYNDSNPAVVGNPGLQPEEIKTYEASINYRFPYDISTVLTLFRNEIEEQITLVSDKYENSGSTITNGLEVEIKIKKRRHYAYANYSYQHSTDKDTHRRTPLTAMHRGNVGVNYAVNSYINFNTNLGLVGERRREVGDRRNELPSYALLDATLVVSDVVKNATLKVSAHNILDKKYQNPVSMDVTMPLAGDQVPLPSDFPRDGRQIMLEVSYYFQ